MDDATATDAWQAFAVENDTMSSIVCSWLLTNVQWDKEPELRRNICGSPMQSGWAKDGDGRSTYLWLEQHGSAQASEIQSARS